MHYLERIYTYIIIVQEYQMNATSRAPCPDEHASKNLNYWCQELGDWMFVQKYSRGAGEEICNS